MRKASRYIIPAALSIMTLAACSNEDNNPAVAGRKDCPDFTATISGVPSRAFDQQWESGDEIGISGANRTNVCYFTNDGRGSFTVKTTGEQIYFLDDSQTAFTAYYPWNDLADGVVSIKSDTRAQNDQKSFDFLWAQSSGTKDAPNVVFQFSHMMAKVSLTVKPGIGMSYDDVKNTRLVLNGFRHTGSFNIADGTTTVDDASEAWTFSDFVSFDDTESTATFSLIFFPQVFDNPLEFLAELDMSDNKILSLKAGIDFTAANREKDGAAARNEWVAGRQYNLSVTLNKTEIAINQCVINPWTVVTGEDITVD